MQHARMYISNATELVLVIHIGHIGHMQCIVTACIIDPVTAFIIVTEKPCHDVDIYAVSCTF